MLLTNNLVLVSASREHKEVISNLMQFYMYDFSEYVDMDVAENGLFNAYPGIEGYWEEKSGKFPYLIQKEAQYAGFALVKTVNDYFSIAEFFILKKYRRQGIGGIAATQLFNLHKGEWEVHQRERNVPAQLFWRKIIAEYTNGQFFERSENGRKIQQFRSGIQVL